MINVWILVLQSCTPLESIIHEKYIILRVSNQGSTLGHLQSYNVKLGKNIYIEYI